MNTFVLGCVFDLEECADQASMLLLRKKRPTSLLGFFNGPGGRVRDEESPQAAMSRECFEEAGVHIDLWEWRHFATLSVLSAQTERRVECFTTSISSGRLSLARCRTDEPVLIAKVINVRDRADLASMYGTLIALARTPAPFTYLEIAE